MIETIKKVATSVETKNVPIATSSVAVMDIENDADNIAPNQGGVLTFTVDSNTNLTGLEVGGSSSNHPPALMVRFSNRPDQVNTQSELVI